MSSRTTPKMAILMGGSSREREVSLSSGRECAAALRETDCDVIEVDAGPDLCARLSEIKPDVVFNALPWSLWRGWLRAGIVRVDGPSLYAFRRFGFLAGDGQSARQGPPSSP